ITWVITLPISALLAGLLFYIQHMVVLKFSFLCK
ncbi:hypothetical protein, partial [Staphylococcus aureus]